ncbi:unnamed protein product [Lactuca saligna]|uniref:Uncharacterized protein n=1 Tax=Lactuca saligna TaxID=75948 RepID=A0AA35UM82_LACSI|nr:unnamed protein product [Lactuca saligna]
MEKCNLNSLYLIRRDTDLSSIDWCDFIVDWLIRMKKVCNPEKESSFFYGPAAYIMEESGGDKDESDGAEDLCDEDEEDCDVNKVSVVEVYENKISYMYQKMEDLKRDLVVKIDEGVLKFPQSQNLKIWKLLFPVEDLSRKLLISIMFYNKVKNRY